MNIALIEVRKLHLLSIKCYWVLSPFFPDFDSSAHLSKPNPNPNLHIVVDQIDADVGLITWVVTMTEPERQTRFGGVDLPVTAATGH
jgi:hypothetical protein